MGANSCLMVVTGCIALLGATVLADDAPALPSNSDLIAAMPPDLESVIVYRLDELAEENAALARESRRHATMLFAGVFQERTDAAWTRIREALEQARIRLFAEGASEFTASVDETGFGFGNYNSRQLYIVADSLEPLRSRLAGGESRDEVKEIPLAGGSAAYRFKVQQYRSEPIRFDVAERGRAVPKPEKITEPRFLAFPSDHALVVTESKADLEYLLARLRAKGRSVPERWAHVAAGILPKSPIVLLRKYDPTNEHDYWSPVNPTKKPLRDIKSGDAISPAEARVDIDSIGLVLTGADPVTFRFKCLSREPALALAHFRFVLREFDCEARGIESGFDTSIRLKQESEGAHLNLVLLGLFGVNMFF